MTPSLPKGACGDVAGALEARRSVATPTRRVDASKGRGSTATVLAVADALRETPASAHGVAACSRHERGGTSTGSSRASLLTRSIDADKTRSPPACSRARGGQSDGDPSHHHSHHSPAPGGRSEAKAGGVSQGDRLGFWSGRRDSNPRRPPWQGGTLPLSYSRNSRETTNLLSPSCQLAKNPKPAWLTIEPSFSSMF